VPQGNGQEAGMEADKSAVGVSRCARWDSVIRTGPRGATKDRRAHFGVAGNIARRFPNRRVIALACYGRVTSDAVARRSSRTRLIKYQTIAALTMTTAMRVMVQRRPSSYSSSGMNEAVTIAVKYSAHR
jgi:hypothetical protein